MSNDPSHPYGKYKLPRKGPVPDHMKQLDDWMELNFNSFSGTDIQCFFLGDFIPTVKADIDVAFKSGILNRVQYRALLNEVDTDWRAGRSPILPFGELQTLTVSSAASVGPVRRLGEREPVEYLSGARTIAGTLVFALLNRDVFSAMMKLPQIGLRDDKWRSPEFIDEIPPFTILIQGSNEYGSVASGMLIDVKLTNFGTTFSVDDMYTEATYNYVATKFIPFVDDVDSTIRSLRPKGATDSLSKSVAAKLPVATFGPLAKLTPSELAALGSSKVDFIKRFDDGTQERLVQIYISLGLTQARLFLGRLRRGVGGQGSWPHPGTYHGFNGSYY